MEFEIRSFYKWLTTFPLNLRMETIFSPKFSVFLMFLCEMNLRFPQKTETKQLPWPELTAPMYPTKAPLWGLTSHRLGVWWMCHDVLYHWPFYGCTWARPESFWGMLYFQQIDLFHPWSKVTFVSKTKLTAVYCY